MVMRIGGLSSGLDTDTTVKELMKARRIPVDKLYQKKQTLEWQREDYRSMNSKLLDYRNTKLYDFKREATLTAKTTAQSGPSDVVSVSTTGTSVDGSLSIEVSQLATATNKITNAAWTGASSALLKDGGLGLVDGATANKFSIKVNNVSFTFDKTTDTLDKVINTINNNPSANATLYFDSTTKKISATSKITGSAGDVVITDVAGEGNLAAKLFSWSSNTPGVDALVKVNGIDTVQSSNTFKVNGTELTLKGVSPSPAPGVYTPTTIEVKADIDKMVESIKSFINDYNDLLKSLNDKVGEEKYRTYTPLTSEQKEAMSEKEVELWEAKAKSGTLKNDSILTKLVGDMRTASISVINTGSSTYKTLSSIGITTGTYQENGKLYLKDEAKLRTALQNEPEAVMALFTSDDDGNGKKGVAEMLYDNVYTAIKSISDKAGTSKYSSAENISLNASSLLGKQLTTINSEITSWNKRLTAIEDRYYQQFAAMEAAMTKYNSQSSYLAQSLGG